MLNRRRVLTALGAAAVGLPRFAHAQGAYKAEYKMSTVVPPAFAWGKGGEIFLTLVKERTNGRINIKQYPGASLVQGQQDREFSAMRQGVIDVLCRRADQLDFHRAATRRLHPAVPDARPQGLGRGDGERAREPRLLRDGEEGRRRAAGDRRDRLPADQQQQAAAHPSPTTSRASRCGSSAARCTARS